MTPTLQTLPLSALYPSKDNPRSATDAEPTQGLAVSIKTDGLLHNLVVTPLKGRGGKGRYALISGHRRYAALCWLQQRGDLAEDYEAPVTILTHLSTEEKLRIATVENVQREDLSPLDEAHAFARLFKNGAALEDLAAQTGLSATTIKRRFILTTLCEEAQAALRDHTLTLAQAEALTLGSADAQRDLVTRITEGQGYRYRAEQIKAHLLDERLPVAISIFPLDHYTGTYTTDLFADEDTTYFDDAEQFWTLQNQAVTELAEHHRQQAAWVDITQYYSLRRWEYDEAQAGDESGVVINLSPTGNVEVAEGLVKRVTLSQREAIGDDHPIAPKPKAAYSAVLCQLIAHEKSLAVQAALLSHPRKAKEVAVVLMLAVNDSYDRPLDLTPHRCLQTGADAPKSSSGYAALEQHAQPLAAQVLPKAGSADKPVWRQLLKDRHQAASLYSAVKGLSDVDLDTLHLLLPILCMGQGYCDRLDTADSFFNQVAHDLEIDMRQWWRPDAGFLSRRTKAQLVDIATASGAAAKLGSVTQYSKTELVTALSAYFAGDAEAARDWLPGAMQFPAIEQDGSTEPAEYSPGVDTPAYLTASTWPQSMGATPSANLKPVGPGPRANPATRRAITENLDNQRRINMIFTAHASTPFGIYKIAVNSDQESARFDLMTAVTAELNIHAGLVQIKDVKLSDECTLTAMEPIMRCRCAEVGVWAWISARPTS